MRNVLIDALIDIVSKCVKCFGGGAIGMVRGSSGKFFSKRSPQGRAIRTARK